MNFVGHSLYTDSSYQLIGNLCADMISPSAKKILHEKILEGLEYHYIIDDFTDHHPFFKDIKSFLSPRYGHYARVIVDLYIDFFIVTNWNSIMSCTYSDHVLKLYTELEQAKQQLPKETHYIIEHLIHYDWLGRYGSISGLNISFREMSRRTPGSICLQDAALDLLFYENNSEDLVRFLRELKQKLEDENKTFFNKSLIV